MRNVGTIGRLAAALAAGLALSGCGDLEAADEQFEQVDPPEADMTRDQPVSRIGDLLEFNRATAGAAGQALPVNRHLWRASVETLSFLPLASTDPFTGVIATDWASNAATPDERYKVTVFITEPALEARALNVAVFREVREGAEGAWTPAPVSETTPRRLEDAILTRARQLRVAELEAEAG